MKERGHFKPRDLGRREREAHFVMAHQWQYQRGGHQFSQMALVFGCVCRNYGNQVNLMQFEMGNGLCNNCLPLFKSRYLGSGDDDRLAQKRNERMLAFPFLESRLETSTSVSFLMRPKQNSKVPKYIVQVRPSKRELKFYIFTSMGRNAKRCHSMSYGTSAEDGEAKAFRQMKMQWRVCSNATILSLAVQNHLNFSGLVGPL